MTTDIRQYSGVDYVSGTGLDKAVLELGKLDTSASESAGRLAGLVKQLDTLRGDIENFNPTRDVDDLAAMLAQRAALAHITSGNALDRMTEDRDTAQVRRNAVNALFGCVVNTIIEIKSLKQRVASAPGNTMYPAQLARVCQELEDMTGIPYQGHL